MTGGWAVYSWPPAIVLVSVMVVFLMDLLSEKYVETKYGQQSDESVEDIITSSRRSVSHRHPDAGNFPPIVLQNDDIEAAAHAEVQAEQKAHQDIANTSGKSQSAFRDDTDKIKDPIVLEKLEAAQTQAYKQQIAAFLVLEFGVIFHSVSLDLEHILKAVANKQTRSSLVSTWVSLEKNSRPSTPCLFSISLSRVSVLALVCPPFRSPEKAGYHGSCVPPTA